MPAIDFPASPAVNDEYSFEGRTWRWNGTGWEVKEYPAALLAGTAANPSLYFSGDPNTGLYSPGADQVAISTGGTGRLFVDASGNVGVGTSVPAFYSGKFAISGGALALTSGNKAIFWSPTDNGTGEILSPAQNALAFNTASTERLRITSDGNVGIGTSSPGSLVELSGSGSACEIRLRSTDTTNATIRSYVNSLEAGKIAFTSGRELFIETAGTERLRITSTGNVGIGTSAPNRLLEVSGPSGTDNFLRVNVAAGAAKSGIEFSHGGAVYAQLYYNNVAPYDVSLLQQYTTGSLILGTNNTERARIDSSGRLLVGTSSTSTLARAVFQGNSSSNPGQVLFTTASSAPSSGATLAKLVFADSGHVSAAEIDAQRDGGTWTSGTSQPTRLVFSTTADGASTPTERLRIANDGRHTINSSAHQGSALTTTAPAKLYISTGTYTDTATAASGTVAHGPIVAFDNPAIAATNATVTYTNASTVYIDGAPTNGTNVTITNAFALFVAAGASRFGGSVLSSSATAGLGYATGAGGAQTQTTSRTQGVTLNTICGAITLVSAAGSTSWQSFTVTNSTVAATDNVIVNQKSGTDLYMIHVTNVAAGSFRITYATTGGTTTEQPVFNFSVIKAVAA